MQACVFALAVLEVLTLTPHLSELFHISLRYRFYCQPTLVAGGLHLIAGQDVIGSAANTGSIVVEVQRDAILLP